AEAEKVARQEAQNAEAMKQVVQQAQENTRRLESASNLTKIALALHDYQGARGHLPPAAIAGPDGRPLLRWRVAILPYLGHAPLYERSHLDEPWDSPHNQALLKEMPEAFRPLKFNTESAGLLMALAPGPTATATRLAYLQQAAGVLNSLKL